MTIPANTQHFRVSFGNKGDSELTTVAHATKAENDQFILGVELMGFNICIKEFFNPNIGEWYRYHAGDHK